MAASAAECVVGDLRKKSLGRTVIVAVVAMVGFVVEKSAKEGQTKK